MADGIINRPSARFGAARRRRRRGGIRWANGIACCCRRINSARKNINAVLAAGGTKWNNDSRPANPLCSGARIWARHIAPINIEASLRASRRRWRVGPCAGLNDDHVPMITIALNHPVAREYFGSRNIPSRGSRLVLIISASAYISKPSHDEPLLNRRPSDAGGA